MVAPEEWAVRYEQVRRQFLETRTITLGWGLALLMRRGMAAWIRAWAAIPSRSAERLRPVAGDDSPSLPATLPSDLYRQVAAILASVFLQTQPEVSL
jgi:hypothetical protein